jgi:catalase
VLRVLADVDPGLCAQVASGLGLPAPASSGPLPDVAPSPALSQIGRSWPVEGRVVGIVADGDSDLDAVRTLRRSVLDAGMVPLVIAPRGGRIADGITVQRTFANARSVEFDAVVLAGVPGRGDDAYGARDAKAAQDGPDGLATDPRVLRLLSEAYRHAKALGGLKGSGDVLTAAGCHERAPGVVLDSDPRTLFEQIAGLLRQHRVWERFPTGQRTE